MATRTSIVSHTLWVKERVVVIASNLVILTSEFNLRES